MELNSEKINTSINKATKVGLGMSGGVDSTACALMLRDHCEVHGFFMQLAQPDIDQQTAKVVTLAEKIDIPLHIVDLKTEFNERVIDYFSNSYFDGVTPNPCVVCNREIKFGLFFEAMQRAGMEKMATGHYAKVFEKNGLYRLYRGADETKDQSYFLSRLTQDQLKRIVFPLGSATKEEIYNFVEAQGYGEFRGLESQDVCFLLNNSIGSYLENRVQVQNSEGPIITVEGKIVGNHKGLYRYTIGQRRGLGVSHPEPLYVVAIDAGNNSLIVGSNDQLFTKYIRVNKIHWLSGFAPVLKEQYNVRIRYSHKGGSARLTLTDADRGVFNFEEPQRAVTPGQFAVVYDDDELLGSAIIE